MSRFEWRFSHKPMAVRLWVDGEETKLTASLVHRANSNQETRGKTERLIQGMVREELGRYYKFTRDEKDEIVRKLGEFTFDDDSTD